MEAPTTPPMDILPTQMPLSILKALLVAQKAVEGGVAKDKTNAHHRYKYASAEAMIAHARVCLSEAGLGLLSAGWRLDKDKDAGVFDEKTKFEHMRYAVSVCYVLFSSTETFSFENSTPIVPENGRPMDKATAAALSYDLAYTLRGLLLIPRNAEENEVDQRSDVKADVKPAPTEAAPIANPLRDELLALMKEFTTKDPANISLLKAEIAKLGAKKFASLDAAQYPALKIWLDVQMLEMGKKEPAATKAV